MLDFAQFALLETADQFFPATMDDALDLGRGSDQNITLGLDINQDGQQEKDNTGQLRFAVLDVFGGFVDDGQQRGIAAASNCSHHCKTTQRSPVFSKKQVNKAHAIMVY